MRMKVTILGLLLAMQAAPAAAGGLDEARPFSARPKTVTAFTLAQQRVEMVAVTKRARADTPLRRAHLAESEAMAKVIPGYPQPAFISVDLRLNF